MRTWCSAFILTACVTLSADLVAVADQEPKYGVTLKVAKAAALAKAKTYKWTPGLGSYYKDVEAQIMAAVDRELSARGLTKLTSGPSDVTVQYASLRSTEVDLKGKQKDGLYPEYPVGTLVVELRDAESREPLFDVRMDTPIDLTPAKLEAQINDAVASMFAKYPAPRAPKR
jgi:hypothetical protein